MSDTKQASAKKAGRPTGAKTQDRPIVEQVIRRDPCPHCGSTSRPKAKRVIRKIDATAMIRGIQCHEITGSNATYADCSRAVYLREGVAVP